MDWMFVFLGVAMVIFGLYTLGIGILGLVRKRPLAFSARTLMWFFFLLFLPNLVNLLIVLFSRWDLTMLLLLVLMIVLVVILWREMKGYWVVGIYDRTFREALASALNKLNVHPQETILKRRSQETITRMRLVELDADLQAAIAEWNGAARIHIEQREHAHLLKAIADRINEYYASSSVKVNHFGFIVYLILGIFMLSMGAVVAFIF
jgi:hypothetical protein